MSMGLPPPARCGAPRVRTGLPCRRYPLSFNARHVCWSHATPDERRHNQEKCRAADEKLRASRLEEARWRGRA